jgi:phosphoribosyl-AMP cyclohydrolase / phosphoribosyl-ATP pyrophosphohydrolase
MSPSDKTKIDLQNPISCAWENLNVKLDSDDLVPAIIQDFNTRKVLMQGYFNAQSWQKTLETGQITFFSRSKKRLWTKGESSGNFLLLQTAALDCDRDTFLIQVNPLGAVCHTGADTCWRESNVADFT